MTAHTPITNEKLRFAALNRHSLRRQGFGVLLSRLESVDSIFHSYTLMQVNFFCQGALVRKLSNNNNNNKIYTRKTLCMPQDVHQGVLIVTAKTRRRDIFDPIGQRTLVYGLEDFFVTNLKLFNSRSSTFLEWSNWKTKFYKDAKQNFTKKAKTITAQKTKFEKPQRSKAKPKLIKTTKPQTQQLS